MKISMMRLIQSLAIVLICSVAASACSLLPLSSANGGQNLYGGSQGGERSQQSPENQVGQAGGLERARQQGRKDELSQRLQGEKKSGSGKGPQEGSGQGKQDKGDMKNHEGGEGGGKNKGR